MIHRPAILLLVFSATLAAPGCLTTVDVAEMYTQANTNVFALHQAHKSHDRLEIRGRVRRIGAYRPSDVEVEVTGSLVHVGAGDAAPAVELEALEGKGWVLCVLDEKKKMRGVAEWTPGRVVSMRGSLSRTLEVGGETVPVLEGCFPSS